jgi:hypothetical protein
VSARFFGLLYLLLIPTYAALYSVLPYQFYHTTVVFEATLRYDGERISEGLREAIVAELRAVYGGGVIGEHGPTVDLSSINIFEMRVERGNLRFAVAYDAKTMECREDREVPVIYVDYVEVLLGSADGHEQPDGRRQFWFFLRTRNVGVGITPSASKISSRGNAVLILPLSTVPEGPKNMGFS